MHNLYLISTDILKFSLIILGELSKISSLEFFYAIISSNKLSFQYVFIKNQEEFFKKVKQRNHRKDKLITEFSK